MPLFGTSLTTVDGGDWLRRRHLLRPLLTPHRMTAFVPLIAESTDAMLERWRVPAENGRPFDVLDEMTELTRAIIIRVLFGEVFDEEVRVGRSGDHHRRRASEPKAPWLSHSGERHRAAELLRHPPGSTLLGGPERFAPERFRHGHAARPRYAYFPFGGGPRACIGSAFALIEMQVVVAMVARRYTMALAPGWRVEPEPRTVLVPRRGLSIVLRPAAAGV